MRKVLAPKVVTTLEASESPLPPRVQEALGEARRGSEEGLLALSVGVGLGVVHELMELANSQRRRHHVRAFGDARGGELALGGVEHRLEVAEVR